LIIAEVFSTKIIVSWLKQTLVYSLWCALSCLLCLIKFPGVVKNLWAEDATVGLQMAIEKPFPEDFFDPYTGYLDFQLHLISNLVSIFPIRFSPYVNFILVVMIYGFLTKVSFDILKRLGVEKQLAFLVAITLVASPSVNYEGLGNATNLHYYGLAVCLLFILSIDGQRLTIPRLLYFGVIAPLSVPLLLPLTLVLLAKWKKLYSLPRILFFSTLFLLSNFVQFLFVMLNFRDKRGDWLEKAGMAEVSYLAIHRVVAVNLIPFAGSIVEGDVTADNGNITVPLLSYVIFVIGIYITLVTTLMIIRFKGNQVIPKLSVVTLFLFALPGFLTVGLIFSPEGRYSVAFSFWFLTTLVLLIQFTKKPKKLVKGSVFALITLSLLTNSGVESLRSEGPEWRSQAEFQKAKCLNNSNEEFQIIVLPTKSPWDKIPIKFKIPCEIAINIY